jgi:hypothetical protein
MADDRNDAADERQHEPRRGLQGKGFDAGSEGTGNVGRDTDGRGSANLGSGAGTPRAPDEEAVNDAFEGRGSQDRESEEGGSEARGGASGGPDAIDLQDMNGASRREPGR